MVDPSSKDEPHAHWPEEVKQAYEHLKIPSLYDAVLANEKLSLEIRRQDRELKAIVGGIQHLSEQMTSLLQAVEEEWEEYEPQEVDLEERGQNGFGTGVQGDELTHLELELLEENQAYLEKQSQFMLMDTHDDMRELSRLVRQVIHQTLALLPKTEGLIPHEPTWYPVAEGMLQGLIESIERTRYQLLARLEEMHIEMVDPQPGEALNRIFHHVVDRLSGGKAGTIAHVVRVGYRLNQEVLRMAEVTVYQ